ncbi:AAA family ATPase [Halopseudomonas nanhaiensis]|uniref:AAA family ATPase n=1 Tax=Halopseudomonas nanhaiensis TaxID=2830842 RepID=UPI001CBBFD1A|nr:AAA family ATPase [Halopseudomonas nanhaiensis]UAW98080.1 AAA family ATPase [Halopseudomonas nanhaiensis]
MKNDMHDLSLLLDSRTRLVIVETWDEPRVLEAIGMLAIRRAQTWYTWNHVEGLRRLGFGSDVEQAEDTADPDKALERIRTDNQPALYVMCDLHPFIDSPRVVRQLKMLAMNPAEPAPTLILVSHALTLPPELRRLASSLSLSMPSAEQLATIVREEAARWSEQNQGKRVRTDNQTLEQVVGNLRGTTHAEARQLARKLIHDDGAITREDLPVLNRAKFGLLGMQGVLSFEYETARFSEVGGLSSLKAWLNDRQAAFSEAGSADVPKGLLLVGVQGAGKSLAAKSVAGVWGLPLLRLDFACLYDKYIGETEKNLREALNLADSMEPCVLWIDEIEKGLAPDSGESGVSRRLLGTLLTWMAERKTRVFLVATANDVSQLPPELIRKGRIDEMFFVDLPDESVRADIFAIHLARRELEVNRFDLPALAAASAGFSGAEIEQAIVAAVYAAAARQEPIGTAELIDRLAQTSPLSVVMAEQIDALRAWAQGRAVMAG